MNNHPLRKSLRGIEHMIERRESPIDIPEALEHLHFYALDSGHCILCVPEVFYEKAKAAGSFDDYEVLTPMLYVLEVGYRMEAGYAIANIPYDPVLGVVVDAKYDLFERAASSLRATTREMHSYEVGAKIPDFAGMPDGVFFSMDGSRPMLLFLMRSPDQSEIESIKQGKPVQVGVVRKGGVLVILSKFGSLEWMDATYNANIGTRPIPIKVGEGGGAIMTAMLADTRDGEIKALRMLRLSTQFTNELMGYISDMLDNPVPAAEYEAAVDRLYAGYSTRDLVRAARTYKVV